MNNDSSERIVEALRAQIGASPAGARLPSTRELVARHGASPVTVQKALRTLAAQGLVESRPGVGTFVRAVRTARPSDYGWQTAALGSPHARVTTSSTLRGVPHGAIALHGGYPDPDLLPGRLVRAALARASRSAAAVSSAPPAGLPELQSFFASELADAVPAGVTPPNPTDVIVLPGTQSGLVSVFRALVPPGEPLLMESPTYWGAILAAAQTGARVVPVASGPDGPDPTELDRAFDETGARAFYAQPTYANPTGAQWSDDVRGRVLEIVRDHGAFLVEDDWAHDFGITTAATPLAAHDDAGHVVYVRSLTKSVSPAVRVGAIIARGPARERLSADRAADAMYVSPVLQAAALDIVTHPGWQTHLRGLRQQLNARRDLLVDSLAEHAPLAHLAAVPPGGLNLWLRLPDATDLTALVRACESQNVLVAAGDEWFPAEPAGPHLRLSFSGPDPGSFPAAARVIGEALRRLG